ncbi:MAG: putative rane protein [Amycolatopsis sp.]|jgi:hypothetical protein|uniref:DUF6542 domain-containing protein n=1 Tax=Amycolatopsis sp. TaxID=37632 RepID=UPI00260692A2|nr:DUF6542 domain-containing protein [Amycolatopsis sp.]MCU1680544.1 putative rane protein [Amycolatopsis sp.]
MTASSPTKGPSTPDSPSEPAPRRRGPSALVITPAALVVSVGAGALDMRLNHTLGVLFATVFIVACLSAALTVRRGSLIEVMLAPPMVFVVAAGIDVLLFRQPGGGTTLTVLAVAQPVVTHFPVMIGATALTLLAGIVRLVLQRHSAGHGQALT